MSGIEIALVALVVLLLTAVAVVIAAGRAPVQAGDSSRLDDMSRPTDGRRSE